MSGRKRLMITQVNSVGDVVRGLRKSGVQAKERFLSNGGWSMIKSWVEQTYSSNNKAVLHEIFHLILELPPKLLSNALLGKENPLLPVLGMIAEEVVREDEGSAQGPTAQLCLKILQQWKRIIKDIKEEKGKLKKGTKVHVTDETGREKIYQTLGEDFKWWLVTLPDGTQEVERTKEDYCQDGEVVIVGEKRNRRSKRISGRKCAPLTYDLKKRRKPPTPPMVTCISSSNASSDTEEVEEEDEKLEDKVEEEKLEFEVEMEKDKLEDKVDEKKAKEEHKVKEDEEKSPPQSPLSPASVKQTRRRYPMRRRRRRQEIEADTLEEEMKLKKAIKREKMLVKFRTPDLCRDEKPGGIFGKRRRVEVIGSEGRESTKEKQEARVKNHMKGIMKVNEEKDEKPKLLGSVDKTGVIQKKRNVSGGGSSSRMDGIVKLMEAIQKPLYPPKKVARILPSKPAAKEEEARKKTEEDEVKQKSIMIVTAIPRNPPPREYARPNESENKPRNQAAVAVIPRGRDPKKDEVKPLKVLTSAGAALNPHDPRLAARKKREDEARKLIEEEDKKKNMVIAIYPLPPETKELDIPPQLSPPPVWKLRKMLIRLTKKQRRDRQVRSVEKDIQQEREQFAFFADFSTDSPAEPIPKDCQPLPFEKCPCIIPSKTVVGTRVYANSKSKWPEVKKDSAPEGCLVAYSSQLFPQTEQKEESLPPAPLQVADSTNEDQMEIVPSVPSPTATVQYVPIWYPVPMFPVVASPPPLPPLPATPPPPCPPPPPPPVEEELSAKTKDYLQTYRFIRIPEIPKKAYVPPLPPPVEMEAIPPREDTPPPPGVDDQRPISPLGMQPLPVPLPVPAPTPQQLALISETPFFPPSLLSLTLSPPAARQQQQHQPSYNPAHRRRIPRSARRKQRSPLLPDPDRPHHFINSPPTQFDYNFFNPSAPQRSDSHLFNPSPPTPQQQFDNNPFINPPPPPSNFYYNLSGYQYPGSPPGFCRF